MSRYAIADIHGCLKTFRKMVLERLYLKPSDQLYLLGDYINKGPDSKGVLDFIMRLRKDGFQVHCIRGNHDQMLLDVVKGNLNNSWQIDQQKVNTLKSFAATSVFDIPDIYIELIQQMPHYLELEDTWLVHAGFFTGLGDPLLDKTAMMNIKRFEYIGKEFSGKRIVHGHVPQKRIATENAITQKSKIIKIDGGCVYNTSSGFGNLFAFDLDRSELIVQPNVDGIYPISKKEQ